MAHHIESMASDYQRSGMSATEAKYTARRRFGSVLKHKEAGHEIRAGRVIEDVWRDARHMGRGLRRSAGFATAPAAAEGMTLALQWQNPPGSRDAAAVPVTMVPAFGGFSAMRSELTRPLVVLLLAVGLLLVTACANIASLLFARATTLELPGRLGSSGSSAG